MTTLDKISQIVEKLKNESSLLKRAYWHLKLTDLINKQDREMRESDEFKKFMFIKDLDIV